MKIQHNLAIDNVYHLHIKTLRKKKLLHDAVLKEPLNVCSVEAYVTRMIKKKKENKDKWRRYVCVLSVLCHGIQSFKDVILKACGISSL